MVDYDYKALKRRVFSNMWGGSKHPGSHILLEPKSHVTDSIISKIGAEDTPEARKDLQHALKSQLIKQDFSHSVIFNEQYYESFTFEKGCLYGISYIVDSSFTLKKLYNIVTPGKENSGTKDLILMFARVADAAQIIIEKPEFYNLGITPIISIKLGNQLKHSEKEGMKVMRKALFHLVKVLQDMQVQLEGLSLGIELVMCHSNQDSLSTQTKSTIERAVYENALMWTQTIPPAIAFINIEVNEESVYNNVYFLTSITELMKSGILDAYIVNTAIGSMIFDFALNGLQISSGTTIESIITSKEVGSLLNHYLKEVHKCFVTK